MTELDFMLCFSAIFIFLLYAVVIFYLSHKRSE